ncbi:hypothetical protein BD413DRAFT_227629 [Trametes elegans]|nr:hypothetical protein BD413DRAFT_227629 [Trametes elegans]
MTVTTSMARVNLNDDTVIQVMPFTDTHTLYMLMLTCRSFYRHGAMYLLGRGVTLQSDTQINSFNSFILTDNRHRIPLPLILRWSYLDPSKPLSQEGGVLLVNIVRLLASADSIVSLTLVSAEMLLLSVSGLAGIIADLRSLKHITIDSLGRLCSKTLQSSRSSLVSANVKIEEGWEESDPPLEDKVPMYFLRNSQQTLEKLSVSSFSSSPECPIYPAVSHLRVDDPEGPGQICDYVYAFPNVRKLTAYGWGRYAPTSAFRMQYRARNRSDLELLGSWASLQEFSGSITSLYLLGIPERIPRLSINDKKAHVTRDMLPAVLDDARPEHLTLDLSRPAGQLHADTLQSVFSLPSLSQVSRLELVLAMYENDEWYSLLQNLGEVIATFVIRPLESLDTFRLRLGCEHLQDKVRSVKPLDPTRVSTTLEALDLEAVALTIREARPTLQSVIVQVLGHHASPDRTVRLGAGA